MSVARIHLGTDGTVAIDGELSFTTVTDLLARSSGMFSAPGTIRVDLQGVSRADSAGLSLLIEWMRLTDQTGQAIEFANLPEQMWNIARTCGLDQVLPIAGDGQRTPAVGAPPARPGSRRRKTRRQQRRGRH